MPQACHVTSCQPGHEVVLAATGGLLRATDKIVVTGGTDGAAVSYDAEVRLRAPCTCSTPSCDRASAP